MSIMLLDLTDNSPGNAKRIGLNYVLRSCGLADVNHPRIVRIQNTLKLDEIWVSHAILEEIKNRPQIDVLDDNLELFA